MLDGMTKGGTLAVQVNNEYLINGLMVIANTDWTDQAAVLFQILRRVRKNHSTIKSLHSRRTHFGLFKEMVGKVKEVRQRLRNFTHSVPWFGKVCFQARQLSASSGRLWGSANHNRRELLEGLLE